MTFAGCPLWNCGRHRDLPLPDDCLPLQGLPSPPHNHLRPLLPRWGDRHLLPSWNGRQSASTDSEVSSSCAASHQLLLIVFFFQGRSGVWIRSDLVGRQLDPEGCWQWVCFLHTKSWYCFQLALFLQVSESWWEDGGRSYGETDASSSHLSCFNAVAIHRLEICQRALYSMIKRTW